MIGVLDRRRRLTQWDIKPPGYENVTAEQAKLSGIFSFLYVGCSVAKRMTGMFPLPGAPRQQPMDPSRLQAFMNQPSGAADSAALKPSNARQSKRLFVYNLPASATEETLIEFFNLQLNGLNVVNSIDPCISAFVAANKEYALVEFKMPADATVAFALNGITMEASDVMDTVDGTTNGAKGGLIIKRPKDYISPSADDAPYQEGVMSNDVPDSPNKILISNLPQYLNDEQVVELLQSFGELKAFVLVKDNGTEESRVSNGRPFSGSNE